MTVEERAQQMIEDHREWAMSPSEGQEELKARVAKRLRDQIEDCAKVAKLAKEECERIKADTDTERACKDMTIYISGEIEGQIRALAAPTENKQEKGK